MKNIYLKHPLFNFFNEQINQLSNEDLFFEGNFLGKETIKIFFNEAMDEWLSIYKEELAKIALNIYEEKKYLLNFNKYLTVFYFYFWILNDIRTIANNISINSNNILNIGAGIGLIDILINKTVNPRNHCMIELDEHQEKFGIDGKEENLTKKIFPLNLLNRNLEIHGLQNSTAIAPSEINYNLKYDLVLSIRSWGFLYPIEEYLADLIKITNEHTIFIADIHNKYLDNLNKYFLIDKKLLNEKIYSRYKFKLKK
jgi:hypothetical protein